MTDPITDAELDELQRFHANVQRALDNHEPMDAAYFIRTDTPAAVVVGAFPRLLAEHRKMRAHIVDTIGEDGLKDVLSGN